MYNSYAYLLNIIYEIFYCKFSLKFKAWKNKDACLPSINISEPKHRLLQVPPGFKGGYLQNMFTVQVNADRLVSHRNQPADYFAGILQ